MRIIWFSWKDRWHPESGGAETVSGEIMDRLVRDGHSVSLFTAKYQGSESYEKRDGVDIFRSGNRYTVYLRSWLRYKKEIHAAVDVVIDEMNTLPFFARIYTASRNHILFVHQLARIVWFYQMPPVVAQIGYIVEPLYLRLVGLLYKHSLTVSNSTRNDLKIHGVKNANIFQIGTELKTIEKLPKKDKPTSLLSLGAVRPMKRTIEVVKAFEFAYSLNPDLTLVIAGSDGGEYAKKLRTYVENSPARRQIQILGRVSSEKRLQLMRDSGVIVVTSIKEGWGLIVTEANSQGTPAAVYDVDGLRDSVRNGVTGMVSENNHHEALGRAIVELLLDTERYEKMRHAAWEWSKQFTFDASYEDFCKKANIR